MDDHYFTAAIHRGSRHKKKGAMQLTSETRKLHSTGDRLYSATKQSVLLSANVKMCSFGCCQT